MKFKSIKTRVTFWFLIVAILPLTIVSIITYIQRVKDIKDSEFEKLTAIRDLKVSGVNNWINERIGDLLTLAQDNEARALEDILKKANRTQEDLNSINNITELMSHYVENYKEYKELFILNPISGKIELSTNKASIGINKSADPYFTEPTKTGKIYIKDIYYSKTLQKNTMAFSIPIYCLAHSVHITGILVCRIDLEKSLYDILLDRTGMGDSGETLIINKDVVALSKLRWHERASLKFKINSKAAVYASQGKTGITEALDYRGNKVLAAYTYISRTKWGFVAKQDIKEVYAPIQTMLRQGLILFGISLIIVYFLAYFTAKNLTEPVLEIAQVSRKIQEGDLSTRSRVLSTDELGYLARSINNMAASLMYQIEVQKGVTDITETMVASSQLTDFCKNLLNKLLFNTGSDLGAFYLRSRDGNRFEHFTSIGANPDLLEPFNASVLEGEFGKALFTKEISHIQKLPEDTVFMFKTFTGTAIPNEILTIPLIVDNEVVAVISLAKFSEYSKENLKILDYAWMGMNTAFSNLLANEETKRLADELNINNQELEAQSEKLQSQAEELQSQTEELQGQNTELEAQRKQVEEATRLKSEFLSNMSHELRTPLNSIMALSRVLTMQARQKLTEEEGGYLEIIERNGKKLLELINDILDLSKIEAGKMDLSPKLFSLKSLIATIVESLEPVAKEKGIEISFKIPDGLPRIESDEVRVHQILQNILGNAVKFTKKGGVTVSADKEGQNVHIKISDTGIGISKEDLPYLFEEFRQVDGSSSRHFNGTGLGLTIADKAVKMLGGKISVHSTPGKGTTFIVIFPIKRPDTISAHVQEEKILQDNIGFAQKTVLIVDDEPNIVSMISDYLSKQGYKTITASSGKDALRLAETCQPFAITLDIMMPDMDGWEVMQNLKLNPVTKDIPVVIVSITDDKQTGLALGAVGHITKPVDKEELISEIRKIGRPDVFSIMVVDDNQLDRENIARIVKKEFNNVIEAGDGKKCMELIQERIPDLLVLDLMMPDLDGFEVLNKLRCDPDTIDLPVIVVTAKDLCVEEKKRLRGNVSSIIQKGNMTSGALLKHIKNTLLEIEQKHYSPGSYEFKTAKRILLVEDNEASIIQVKTVLQKEGYDVDVARGGQEALDFVKQTIHDGIILDLMMPEIDGFEVLEEIRGTKSTTGIPVLVLTAKDLTEDDFKKLSSNNIKQLIQKGDVDQKELILKIKQMLGEEPNTRNLFVKQDTDVKKPEAPGPETAKTSPIKGMPTILVVEDNEDNMITIKAMIKDKYNILETTDGEQGLKTAVDKHPDLILLDMSLPVMDGYTMARKLKDDQRTGHIPVIALTAQAMKGDRENIIEAGCNDYISKPVDPEEVINKIKKWLDSD